jgi:hypothetical protein
MAANRGGRPVLFIDAGRLLAHPPDVQRALQRALLRDLRLLDAVPVLTDVDEAIGADGERDELPAFVTSLCREHPGSVVLTISRKQLPRLEQRPLVHIALDVPSTSERSALWRNHAGWLEPGSASTLGERFAVTGGVIVAAVEAAQALRLRGEDPPDVPALDLAVRSQLHDRIMRLGRRLDTPYTAKHLVVDDDVLYALDEIVACVRERRKVREQWGFKGAHGMSVLFSGEPGVGKTMSAKVLGKHLGLAVYEIDLSRVTSKWIGETEKNLSEVFDAGEPGHVLLLFNEADSLFGKRVSDVGSANDRYANLETNYLLQRLEAYGGLAVLTTNRASAIDAAFRRRFAYDVQFAFPSADMRAELWRRIIPKEAEVADLDFRALAERYELSGGYIKIAAERAAFMAAGAGHPIGMDIVGRTIERMYRERGKLSAVGKLE